MIAAPSIEDPDDEDSGDDNDVDDGDDAWGGTTRCKCWCELGMR